MKNLYVYLMLHGNLSFSCIPHNQYSIVLDKCYWPVLDIVKKGYKMGIEFPGETLEEIDKIDSTFIKELKLLWNEGKCDFIGSSFTQSVFPLVPREVNEKNLSFAKEIYESFLGRAPELAFVNEQTFSKEIPSLYIGQGYKALIMDWDNASEYNDYPDELRYRPAFVESRQKKIKLLWNSSLNSYKFQRCIYNRIPLEEYVSGVQAHVSQSKNRAIPLYGTDWENYNYRPGTGEVFSGEIEKIQKILEALAADPRIVLVRPSEVLELIPPEDVIEVSSPECPIPCKNRDDYNVIRWAVSGRDDVQINTQCHLLFNHLKDIEFFSKDPAEVRELWKSLCHLWGSDYRTKTTNEKFYFFRNNMGEKLSVAAALKNKKSKALAKEGDLILVNTTGTKVSHEPVEIILQFEKGKYKTANVGLESEGKDILCQNEEYESYRDGSIRSMRITAELNMEKDEKISCRCYEKEKPVTGEGMIRIDRNFINVDTPHVFLSLCKDTGADIRELVFKKICEAPVIKYLPPVYFDHIGHSNDYYSGWNQYCLSDGTIFNDTINVSPRFDRIDYPIRIPVCFTINLPFGMCWKTVYVYTRIPRIDIRYRFAFNDLYPVYFRSCITTFNPEAFSRETLGFSAVNGTEYAENYPLKGRKVMHHKPVGPNSSGTTCLGATEGWVNISDNDKAVAVISDKSALYNVPMIEYEEIDSRYLLRLYNSLSESDETGKVLWRGQDTVTFAYIGHKNKIDDIRKSAAVINRKIMMVKKKLFI
jgi:hypothetical protein